MSSRRAPDELTDMILKIIRRFVDMFRIIFEPLESGNKLKRVKLKDFIEHATTQTKNEDDQHGPRQ